MRALLHARHAAVALALGSATACASRTPPALVACTSGGEVLPNPIVRIVADSIATAMDARVLVRYEASRSGVTDVALKGPKGSEARCASATTITFDAGGSMLSDASLFIRSHRPVALVVTGRDGALLGDTLRIGAGHETDTIAWEGARGG